MEFIGGLYQGDYWFARFLLQRAIGFIYLLAFINALNQFIPLLGEDGLLPLPDFLERMTFKEKPSIFHWYYSDQFFKIVAWSGIALSLLAISGITDSRSILAFYGCMAVIMDTLSFNRKCGCYFLRFWMGIYAAGSRLLCYFPGASTLGSPRSCHLDDSLDVVSG